jgi:serine/threonine protein kinase
MNLPQWNYTSMSSAQPPAEGDVGCAAPRSDVLLPGTRLEEFEVERVLAASGFGIVYLAQDNRAERRVVIKEYLPLTLATRDADGVRIVLRAASHAEAFERGRRAFIEEALLLERCEHPSLVKVLGSWHGNGTVYRAMPHYPGQTLLSLRQRLDAPPDEPSLRALLDGVLGALEVLHEEGMVHGGITPTNLLLMPDDHPVLLDGGAAQRAIVGAHARALLTLLEPSFAAPEQTGASPDGPIGPWTDLYGLAAVMHYCVSGVMPRMASDGVPQVHEPLAAVVQRLRARLPSLHVSRQFAAAIDAALSPSPDARPRSVAEFRSLLDSEAPTELLVDLPAHAEPDDEPALHGPGPREASNDPAIGPPTQSMDEDEHEPPMWRPRRRESRVWPRWALAAGLLLAVGAAAWTMLPQSPGPEVLARRDTPVTPPVAAAKIEPLPAPPVATAPTPAPLPPLPETPTAAIDKPQVAAAPVAKAAPHDEAARKTAFAKPAKQAAPKAVGAKSAATPSAAAKPPAVRLAATSPRELCGGRTQFSLYRCMQTQCAQAAWSQHVQCKLLRTRDLVE